MEDNKLIIYKNNEGNIIVDAIYKDETLWLSQKGMSKVFECSTDNISLHLKHIFEEKELDKKSVTEKCSLTADDGKNYNTTIYSLDAIIAVGYRVNSKKATEFRIWATKILKEYMIKGFALNDERFINGNKYNTKYFDELLERIKTIRVSERMACQKITDLFIATAADYNPKAEEAYTFFKIVQNKLHFAISGHTAAELIYSRANSDKEHMGLTNWKNSPDGLIYKYDVIIAKNYLNEEEMNNLKDLTNLFLVFAEDEAKQRHVMTMKDWIDATDDLLKFRRKEILNNSGSISHKEAVEKAEKESNNQFILIPKIKTEREEGEYYFDDFDLDTSKFNQKPIDNKLLLQNLIDASEVEIMEGGYINFDAVSPEKTILEELRNKSEIDYEKTSELLYKLISQAINKFRKEFNNEQVKNIVMMYKKELATEIYNQMLKHFVRNEGIIKEEVFAEKPINYQSNYTYNIKKNLFDNYDSDRDGRITSILFDGIKRGVFDTAKFDSVPELQLAKIVERETNFVEKWLRPSPIDFNITYNDGKSYEPDFVIETAKIIYLVEVKGDDKLNDPDVLAKKQKSIEYCKLVSKWAEETGNKKWIHIFIPASKISSISTFKYLSEYYAVE